MKKLLFSLATAGTLLLSSCDRKAETATSTTTTETAATDGTASGDGHDHAATNDHAAMAGGGMMAAMTQMMDGMRKAPSSKNTDHDFAHQMAEHHKGALAMADVELAHGKNAALRAMANQMKADQQREIAELEAAGERLDAAPANYKDGDPFATQMKAAMDVMMHGMGTESGDVDADFAAMMIPHHQSAVAMVDAFLAHGKDAKLREMAQLMKTAQQKEIKEFQAWQAKNGGAKAVGAAYICPMKCEGSASDKPGKCPTCGMDLVKNS
jgi:uncharacterized protein (DUF305 family)